MSIRLDRIASYVNDGIGVADVGTDHGYLPLMLLRGGYKGNIVATDINASPLAKAEKCLADAGFSDRVRLLLCDGLDGCRPDDIDTIIVAGMGGDTITGILDRAEWCSREDIKLILQPVTKPEILRYWLINNEFCITDEDYVSENGVIYQIICAKPGTSEKYLDAELFTGFFSRLKASPLCEEVLAQHKKRFNNAICGLDAAVRPELYAWRELMRNMLSELNNFNNGDEHEYDNRK